MFSFKNWGQGTCPTLGSWQNIHMVLPQARLCSWARSAGAQDSQTQAEDPRPPAPGDPWLPPSPEEPSRRDLCPKPRPLPERTGLCKPLSWSPAATPCSGLSGLDFESWTQGYESPQLGDLCLDVCHAQGPWQQLSPGHTSSSPQAGEQVGLPSWYPHEWLTPQTAQEMSLCWDNTGRRHTDAVTQVDP